MPKRDATYMAEQRQLILAAALECFADKGLHKTSIDGIARAAGISKGAVYVHFKSKDEIFAAITADTRQQVGAFQPSTLVELKDSLAKAAREMLRPESKNLRVFSLRFAVESIGDPHWEKIYARSYQEGLQSIERFLEVEPRSSCLDATARTALARQIVMLWGGFGHYAFLMPSLDTEQALEDSTAAVDALIDAAVRRASAQTQDVALAGRARAGEKARATARRVGRATRRGAAR